MTNRWEVERAVLASDLPPMARYVLLVLLIHADARTLDTGKFTPSLSDLTAKTGLDRKTVRRHLDTLERYGWVIRHRPPVELARAEHARTRYALSAPSQGAQGSQPRGAGPLDLGAQLPRARGRGPLRSDQSDLDQISSQVIEKIIHVLADYGPAVDREWAEQVARRIGPGKSNTLRFIETCIRNDPKNYLPTPQPPRWTASGGFE